MKSMRRGMAVLLAALLMMPTMPARAEEEAVSEALGSVQEVDQPAMIDDKAIDISDDPDAVDEEMELANEDKDSVLGTDEAEGTRDQAEDGVESDDNSGIQTENPVDGSADGTAIDADGDKDSVSGTDEAADTKDQVEDDAESAPGTVTGNPADDSVNEGADVDGDVDNGESSDKDTESDTDAEADGTGVEAADGADAEAGGDSGLIIEDHIVDESGDVTADELESGEGEDADDEAVEEWDGSGVLYSTGGEYRLVVDSGSPALDIYGEIADAFGEDGSYTIPIPEEDPFFPYEVQFGNPELEEMENLWFMTPDSTVEYGGHTFRVEANFTGKAMTQLSLNIAGDVVVVYPGEKSFGGAEPISLLPLKEVYLRGIDVTGYTPLELTRVSIESIFTGKVEMTDTDRIMWTASYGGTDYTINQVNGCLDLSYASRFQMIVGEPDQLAADNTRYLVSINKSDDEGWLTPVFYGQGEDGTRTEVEVKRQYYNSGDGYDRYGSVSFYLSSSQGDYYEGYLGLRINAENYKNTRFTSVRAFSGHHQSAAEAMAAQEITGQVFCGDMAQKDAGYPIRRYNDCDITLVSFDAGGNVTGCLPVSLNYSNLSSGLYTYGFLDEKGNWVSYTSTSRDIEGCTYYTGELYSGYPANGTYYQRFEYDVDGETDNSRVTAAYRGRYASIAEAVENGAEDVMDKLFGRPGYGGDYSEGIYFTIFIGADGTEGQEVYQYQFKTEEGGAEKKESYVDALNSGTAVHFSRLRDGEGNYVSSFALQDSYAESNFIVYLVDEGTDLRRLAPEFRLSYDNLKLYAVGSAEPEVSGESYHDFSKGAVQYTASSEDKTHSKNYWVQVVTKGQGQIFMNSLADPNVETTTQGGAVYTTREVMLDVLHDDKHDIMLANMGTQAIQGLSAELNSNTLELDDYWTLKGNHELSGFTTTDRTTSFGELSNLAMLRLRKKEGVADGSEVSGTLTIKAGSTVLMVMKLTGTVGDPVITTTEIPAAVKYVPYGTMIQSSNKYSWNEVSFELWSGRLPGGMVIKPNGELYGVPTQAGEFTFTVRMTNSFGRFGEQRQEFTLVVKENTDANVDGATDESYNLTERVAYQYNTGLGAQRMVSQGVFEEFVDLWLDGVKLERGVDYEAESGSTRITIASQTLGGKGTGTHTLGIEFRTSDTDSVRRAAQNYVMDNGTSQGGDKPNGNEPSGNNPGSSSPGNTATGENRAESSASDAVSGTKAVSYTVERGDTLWAIAVKFFGDGNQWKKIYKDNKEVISDPNRIYAGQVLTINVAALTAGQGTVQGDTYTVQPGDSLWKIAEKVYGNGRRWRKIYEANADRISDASKIYAGQTLVVPK